MRNPATGVQLPRIEVAHHRYLTHRQVHQLSALTAEPYGTGSRVSHAAREAARRYGLVVLFLSYTGVRFGEMAALRVGRLDFERRRALIAESVTLVRGVQVWGTPKGHEMREVPIPRFLIDELAEHVATMSPDDLVFPGSRVAHSGRKDSRGRH